MEVTLELSDQLYEQAKQWAAITEQDLDTALTEALTVVLTPVHTAPELDEQVTSLSDEQVLEQAEMRMAPSQGQRLSLLLAKRREGSLTEEEQRELFALFQTYQRLWLRQSEALSEAIRRGLRPPLGA